MLLSDPTVHHRHHHKIPKRQSTPVLTLSIKTQCRKKFFHQCFTNSPTFFLLTNFVLPGCYAAFIGSYLRTFREELSVSSSTMKAEPIGCLEMSVTNYQYTRRNILEERKSHLQRMGSFNHTLQRILHILVLLSCIEPFAVTILYEVRRHSCIQFLQI